MAFGIARPMTVMRCPIADNGCCVTIGLTPERHRIGHSPAENCLKKEPVRFGESGRAEERHVVPATRQACCHASDPAERLP